MPRLDPEAASACPAARRDGQFAQAQIGTDRRIGIEVQARRVCRTDRFVALGAIDIEIGPGPVIQGLARIGIDRGLRGSIQCRMTIKIAGLDQRGQLVE